MAWETYSQSLEKKETPEILGLKWLKESIQWDFHEFENLSKDKDVQNSLEKVFNKCTSQAFEKEWKNFEKIDVSQTLKGILDKNPKLRFYITWTLKLPLWQKDFSKMSSEQKFNFMALYNTFFDRNFLETKLQPKNPIDRCDLLLRAQQDKVNSNFKWKNISNRLMIEKTLTEDFGLTRNESSKFVKYLAIIKKHPEYIGIMKVQECGIWKFWWWMIVWAIAAILAGFWIQHIVNMWKPETISTVGWPVNIQNPQDVLKFFSKEFDVSHSGSDKIKMFENDENDGMIKSVVKDVINRAESRSITMNISWKAALQFDLDKWCAIQILDNDGDGKDWVARILLPDPDVIIIDSNAEVLDSDLEWFHLSKFDQTQENLRNRLVEEMRQWVKDHQHYEEWKNDVSKTFLKMFQVLNPEGIEITKVEVAFFNPEEHPQYGEMQSKWKVIEHW